MKTQVSLLLMLMFITGITGAENEATPDEALLEFLASFDMKDSEYIDAELEAQQQGKNDHMSGESHD